MANPASDLEAVVLFAVDQEGGGGIPTHVIMTWTAGRSPPNLRMQRMMKEWAMLGKAASMYGWCSGSLEGECEGTGLNVEHVVGT